VTVNSELQQKIDALSRAHDDMTNLLAATEIGTVLLDSRLNIQRFTPTVKKVINLIDTDVGRPIQHIVHNLGYDRLVKDAEEVLRTLNSKQVEVKATSGNWYSMSILPYRTTQNVIEGVVVTFVNITDRKQALMKLEESELRYRSIGELVAGVWNCTPDAKLTYLSPNFLDMLGVTQEEMDDSTWIEQMHIPDAQYLIAEWNRCAKRGGVWHHKFTVLDKSGKERKIVARGFPVKDTTGKVISWVGINLDITEPLDGQEECLPESG